jgi:nucleoside-diphosphate-sugar epimerase/uncharacterized tellurite resistance protein B-like protein
MRIAITGAGGHVGFNLVRRLLDQRHELRAFDLGGMERLPEAVERWPGDVCNEAELARCFAGCELVFHLAGVISIDGDRGGLVQQVNVGGARAAANAALASRVRRFVHFSSIQAFDSRAVEGVLDEESPRSVGAHCPAYDRSKHLGEWEVRGAVERGLDAVIVHPTGVIGAEDHGPSRAGQGLLDAARGRMPIVVEGGFDWVDVADVAQGAWLAATLGGRGRSYILSGHYCTMTDLLTLAARCAGASAPLVALPRWLLRPLARLPMLVGRMRGKEPLFTTESLDTLGTSVRFSHRRAQEELGYQPRPTEKTVNDLVEFFVDAGKLPRAAGARRRSADPQLHSEFVRQLLAAPLDGAREREILGALLAEVAAADETIAPAERELVSQFAALGPDELLARPAVTREDLEALAPEARQSLLMVALALVWVDEQFSHPEREAIERVRRELGVAADRAAELERWAREFVVDQALDAIYTDGVMDPDERRHIEALATRLAVAPEVLARLDARARRRRLDGDGA